MASYLLRNSPVPTSEKKFTFSTWFKLSAALGSDNGIVEWYKSSNERYQILIDSATRQLRLYAVEAGTVKANIYTDMAFRDTNAWYHIVIHSDTTQSSSSDAFKLWVNGVAQTFSSYTWSYNQNANVNVFDGSSTRLNLGVRNETSSNFINGYLADTYYIDGSLIAYTEFGETDSTSGIWKPNTEPTISSFGNAGVHLKYENSGTIGLDSSGNTNNFTASGTITQAEDTPSNNFATFNPLDVPEVGEKPTYSYGNLQGVSTNGGHISGISSLGMVSGKYYVELKATAGDTGNFLAGIITDSTSALGSTSPHDSSKFYGARGDGTKYTASTASSSWGSTWTTNDIIGLGIDLDNNRLYISKNGQWSDGAGNYDEANPNAYVTLASNQTYFVIVGDAGGSVSATWQANFGNGRFGTTALASSNSDSAGLGLFEYSVPSGYYALCTKNIKNYG